MGVKRIAAAVASRPDLPLFTIGSLLVAAGLYLVVGLGLGMLILGCALMVVAVVM